MVGVGGLAVGGLVGVQQADGCGWGKGSTCRARTRYETVVVGGWQLEGRGLVGWFVGSVKLGELSESYMLSRTHAVPPALTKAPQTALVVYYHLEGGS